MNYETARINHFDYDPAPVKPEAIADTLNRGKALDDIETILMFGASGMETKIEKGERGRIKLTREGKKTAKDIWENISEIALKTENVDIEELEVLFEKRLGDTPESRLLRQSLMGRINWERKQAYYQMLEQQRAEELFSQKYYPELGNLAGAARFQYELSQLIKQKEAERNEPVEIQAEINEFNAVLEEEAEREARKAQALMEQEPPSGSLWARAKRGWNKLKNQVEKEGLLRASGPHLKKLGYAACVGVVIAVSLSGAVAPALEAAYDNHDHSLDTEDTGKLVEKGAAISTTLSENVAHVVQPVGVISATGQAKAGLSKEVVQAVVQNGLQEVLKRISFSKEPTKEIQKPVEKEAVVEKAIVTPRVKIGPIKAGDVIGINAAGESHQVTVQENGRKDPFDMVLTGRPDSLDADTNGEFALFQIHSGQIKGEQDGERIKLPGTNIDQAIKDGKPVRLEINGQTFRVVFDGPPIVMGTDVYKQIRSGTDGYEHIKQVLGRRPSPQARWVVFDYCGGVYDKGTGEFPFAKLVSGYLVLDIPDTLQAANGRTLPGRT